MTKVLSKDEMTPWGRTWALNLGVVNSAEDYARLRSQRYDLRHAGAILSANEPKSINLLPVHSGSSNSEQELYMS